MELAQRADLRHRDEVAANGGADLALDATLLVRTILAAAG
jgi:hypothetical protein